MDLLSIILIAIGLAMDCFAVSTTKGLLLQRWSPWVLLMALLFGLFQGGMPLIGYYAGSFFSDFFSRFAPWIALLILSFIGGKMLLEKPDAPSSSSSPANRFSSSVFSLPNLFLLAIATSIDALATGVIFIPCPSRLWLGVCIIALVSFLFSLLGFALGAVFGNRFHYPVERLGGLILILIGLKIWIEGVFFS